MSVFFKENMRYPVWTCSDPISVSKDPIFSASRDTMMIFSDSRDRFSILGTRIGLIKHLKNAYAEVVFKRSDLKYFDKRINT